MAGLREPVYVKVAGVVGSGIAALRRLTAPAWRSFRVQTRLVGLAKGVKLTAGSVGPLYIPTVTVKLWVAVVWSTLSVAVTVINAVSPTSCVCDVSMSNTPLGLVDVRVVDVIVMGLTGWVVSAS